MYQTCFCNLKTSIIYFQTNMNWAAIYVKTDVFIYLAYSTVESKSEKSFPLQTISISYLQVDIAICWVRVARQGERKTDVIF